MDAPSAEQQWRLWVESEIGGPEARIEAAMLAVTDALNKGLGTDEVANAAYDAAALWKDPNACVSEAKELFRGRVAGLQQRLKARRFFYIVPQGAPPPSMLIWNFRLERTTPAGEPLPYVDVELRSSGTIFSTSRGFKGCLLDGDCVEVDSRDYERGSILKVTQVYNLATNTVIRAGGESPLPIFKNRGTERYGVLRGQVLAAQQIQDVSKSRILIYNFRLQRSSPDGDLLPVVEVEIRGREFTGSIVDGDQVEVNGRGYKTGDVVEVKVVRNLGSNSLVKARSWLFG
jgi:hypothetical protein